MATKKKFGIGMAAIAAGAGATAIAVKKHRKAENEGKQKEASASGERQEYRNTERGKNQKNSKGIYYTNGNYEAFARPKSLRVWRIKMPTLLEVVLRLWQQPASWYGMDRCPALTSIFWRQWTLPVAHAMEFMMQPEDM